MIPIDHPRYTSLIIREEIINGINAGITSQQGLIAHGRGEAFDYLIGEKTTDSARHATKVAVAMMLLAKHPIISVNGNAAALVPDDLVQLSNILRAPLEVNLFYKTEERVKKIITHLKDHGARKIFGLECNANIPKISHERAKVTREGIYSADVILVPLEDGDRCEALVNMGKKVIAIDLNPLCRTARTATISIIDNIVRVIPNMILFAKELILKNESELRALLDKYDNKKMLQNALDEIYYNITHKL
ncbi:MAG TPA: phosphopantothenate/pantothenate synthetase [Methanosarcinales archaeon]|nr:phosphopantothenate/pantothenate synthetase [Methanosarcinales archaeon]